MKYYRRIVLPLSVILLICMAACASGADSGAKTAPEDFTDPMVTLKLWHVWVSDSDSNKEPFERSLENWSGAHPNIHIETEATESETYKTRLRTAIAVNEAPDIFYSWGAGFAKPFVEAGKVMAIDDYLSDADKSGLVPGSLSSFTYDGKIYALPTFMVAGIFYCNRELFDKFRVKIPDTYAELLDAIKIFKSGGIVPIVLGLKDGWPGIFYQNILSIRIAGINKCAAALNKEATFYQPEFIESAQNCLKAGTAFF